MPKHPREYLHPWEEVRVAEITATLKELFAAYKASRKALSDERRAIFQRGYNRKRYADSKPSPKRRRSKELKAASLKDLERNRLMRGIIINPWTRKVHAIIQRSFSLHEMYAALSHGANLVDDINSISLGRLYLWVDGEGLLKEGIPTWKLNGYPQPLAGKGLILGIDERGENTTCALDARHAADMVTWTSLKTTGRLTAPRSEGNTLHLGNGIFKTGEDE